MITLILIIGIILGLIISNIKPLLYNRVVIEEGMEGWSKRSSKTGEIIDYNRTFVKYKYTFRINKSYTYIKKDYLEEQ
jgi:hypothetical protein